jgi:hypothetical protein
MIAAFVMPPEDFVRLPPLVKLPLTGAAQALRCLWAWFAEPPGDATLEEIAVQVAMLVDRASLWLDPQELALFRKGLQQMLGLEDCWDARTKAAFELARSYREDWL